MVSTGTETFDVVIVGAGPVGLYAAARLGSLGISVLVLERNDEPHRQGSKALCIQSDVLDLLDTVGCGKPLIEIGCAWNVSRTFIGSREIRTTIFEEAPSGTPAFVNVPQWRVEEQLRHAALGTGRVTIEWGAEFLSLTQAPAASARAGGREVEVVFRRNGERVARKATFLLGCDGVRSNVREALGVAWLGRVHADRFLIADVKVRTDWPKERRFWFDAASNAGRQIVIHPQPDDVWRIDWQLPGDCDPQRETTIEHLGPRIRALAGDVPFELDWASTYQFHQKHAEKLRVGNVFLAGDAAHALPPFGARGMNSGLQDAENLAWKVAATLNLNAGDGLLDSYDEERLLAARENVSITGDTIRFMVPPTRLHHIYRNALLRLSARFPRFNRFVNSGRMSTPTCYRGLSAIQAPTQATLAPGDLIPNLAFRDVPLRNALSGGFALIVDLRTGVGIEAAEHAARDATIRGMGGFFQIVTAGSNGSVDRAQEALLSVLELSQAAAILVRPDGYVAGVAKADPADMIGACLKAHGMEAPLDRAVGTPAAPRTSHAA
jgi:3-(3-hydroxy-phenyl)propionate hydroxylase